MIIYNVTVKVHWSIHDAWLQWMQQKHMREILETGCFTRYQIVKLLGTDEDEGPTYAIQYYAENMEAYERYIEHFAEILRQESMARWGNKFIAFRSLMQIVH